MQNLNDQQSLEDNEQHNLAETEQNRTEQADPTASLTEIDSASFLTTLSDGTPTWQSENYFYAWPSGATDITVRRKAKDELVGATYNLFAWQSLKTKESTQVAFFLSYYKAAPPKSSPIDPIDGLTALRYGERNYLMVATRLYAEGKTKQAPEALAEDMRKWNNNIAEPFFLTAEGHQFYYKNPLTVNVSPFNNFENHAIGRSGNVGELSQLKIKPTKTYKMEVGELGGGGKMDNYPAKKIYADIIDPNTSIDNSPYERAVKKEQLDQMPGPYDSFFFRALGLIEAAGGGIGNAAKGKNTLHGGSYKNNTANSNKTTAPKTSPPTTHPIIPATNNWQKTHQTRRQKNITTIQKRSTSLDAPTKVIVEDIINLHKNSLDHTQLKNLSDIVNLYTKPETTAEQKAFISDKVLKPAQGNLNNLLPSANEVSIQLKEQAAKKTPPVTAPKTPIVKNKVNTTPAITKLPSDFSFDEAHISFANIKITVKDGNANITGKNEEFKYSRLSNKKVDIQAERGKSYQAEVTGVHTIDAIDYKTVTDIDPITKKSTKEIIGTLPTGEDVYKATIWVYVPELKNSTPSGGWIKKANESTLFPKSWKMPKIKAVVYEASQNIIKADGNQFTGETADGIRIRIIINDPKKLNFANSVFIDKSCINPVK